VWRRDGLHEADARRISFACTGAVAYKCVTWGYHPGADPSSLGWRAHQACTRMARADYCGNGHTHTRVNTEIVFYDFAGVTRPPPRTFPGPEGWPPRPGQTFFEAAWKAGANGAVCMSRVRWQSLTPISGCTDTELQYPGADTRIGFCEDIDWSQGAGADGTLLFNESHYDDLGLHIWINGNDRVSTVRGFFEVPLVHLPFDQVDGTYTHVINDGMLLRVIPGDRSEAEFEQVHLYYHPARHDFVVAGVEHGGPDLLAKGFTDRGFEGWVTRVLPDPPGQLMPFDLYENVTTGDWLSSVTVPPGGNYQFRGTIGYTLPAETLAN
jgi:hypothetical protein